MKNYLCTCVADKVGNVDPGGTLHHRWWISSSSTNLQQVDWKPECLPRATSSSVKSVNQSCAEWMLAALVRRRSWSPKVTWRQTAWITTGRMRSNMRSDVSTCDVKVTKFTPLSMRYTCGATSSRRSSRIAIRNIPTTARSTSNVYSPAFITKL